MTLFVPGIVALQLLSALILFFNKKICSSLSSGQLLVKFFKSSSKLMQAHTLTAQSFYFPTATHFRHGAPCFLCFFAAFPDNSAAQAVAAAAELHIQTPPCSNCDAGMPYVGN
jgi:hypothetical protein